MSIADYIFVFEPHINLVLAWLIFCAGSVMVGFICNWIVQFALAKYRRMRRLKRLKGVRYV